MEESASESFEIGQNPPESGDEGVLVQWVTPQTRSS